VEILFQNALDDPRTAYKLKYFEIIVKENTIEKKKNN